jgi:hypothetical protein
VKYSGTGDSLDSRWLIHSNAVELMSHKQVRSGQLEPADTLYGKPWPDRQHAICQLKSKPDSGEDRTLTEATVVSAKMELLNYIIRAVR